MMKRLPLFGIASVLFGILITVAPAQAKLKYTATTITPRDASSGQASGKRRSYSATGVTGKWRNGLQSAPSQTKVRIQP